MKPRSFAQSNSLSIVFSSKAIFLSIEKNPEIQKIEKKENFRSSILDKDGNILAKSVPIINLGINPNLVINKEKLLEFQNNNQELFSMVRSFDLYNIFSIYITCFL